MTSASPIPATRVSLLAGGRTRTLTIVGAPVAAAPRALVVVFHGSRQTADVHRAFTGGVLDELAASGEAVVAYLDGHHGNWNDARRESRFRARIDGVDDVAFFRAVVASLAQTHGIDARRVVALGFSNGGQFVLRLLHETPAELAAGVVVAASMPAPESFVATVDASDHRPAVALVAGTRDPIIPFRGGALPWWVRALFRIGGSSLSATETAHYFARRNGIGTPAASSDVPQGALARGTRVERVDYREAGRAPVSLYIVHGGGHTVPGPQAAPPVVGRTTGDISVLGIVRELLEGQETGASRSSSS